MKNLSHYVIEVHGSIAEIEKNHWNRLLQAQAWPTPFMRHEYLQSMQSSLSACENTGWRAHFITLKDQQELVGACPLYLKMHSYGEYVFDWAWADAYQRHGFQYYPKAVIAVPFTPVPGTRLMSTTPQTKALLLEGVLQECKRLNLSSLHMLFCDDHDLQLASQTGLMSRHTVQFHWQNTHPKYKDFEDFLACMTQEKRKKIRQERKKVSSAGVSFKTVLGHEMQPQDWDFFYACYSQTYREHGNPPYIQRSFFQDMAQLQSHNWVIFIAQKHGAPIACSLIGLQRQADGSPTVAYGRYWGALERVDCLHFEACYYQPLEWCIANGVERFEGGAQGEHKMARALLPSKTHSAHWLAHPGFAKAVDEFLTREGQGVEQYMEHLSQRNPLKN
jgi:predicted N-acyltransferase